MEQEIKWPLLIKECACGHTRRILDEASKGTKERGLINSDAILSSRTKVLLLTSTVPKLSGIKVDAVILYFDICAKCGTEYCFRAELTQVDPEIYMRQQGQGKN